MILSTLKAVCAAYHKKTAGDLTVNSVDLFLVAANNVRHSAEQRHNFELSRLVATLDIDGVEGASLDDADIEDNEGNTIVVTGVASPPAGTYSKIGTFLTGDLYLQAVSPAWFIGYAANDAAWMLSTTVSGDLETSCYKLVASAVSPLGSYTGIGTFVGQTAVVAAGTTNIFDSVKEVVAVMRQRPDGTFIPLDFARADIPIERDRTELEFEDSMFPYVRYPSDADIRTGGSSSSIIQRGRKLEIYPHFNDDTSTPLSTRIEGFGWLADYVAADLSDTSPSDFFVEHGAAYLQWGIIIELNSYFKTFVPRTEGNLGEPQAKMDAAWRDMLLWDSYMVDANTTRSL